MAPVSLFARNYLSSVVKLKHNHTHLNCLRALSFRMMPLVSFIIMALGLCLSLSLVSESKPLHRKHRSEPGGLLFNYPYHPGKTVFKLHQNLVGRDFFQAFRWETENDPTHGRVNYVDMKTAIAENLTHGRKSIVNDEPFNCNPDMTVATNDKFTMCVDSKNIVSPTARGRSSNRISSYETYTDSVLVLDVQHVPDSICGVWPAFWTVTASGNWPNGGEIDIYEGTSRLESEEINSKKHCTYRCEREHSKLSLSPHISQLRNARCQKTKRVCMPS